MELEMVERMEFAQLLECDASGGRALIKGLDRNNEPIELQLTLEMISAFIPNLVASETELQNARDGQDRDVIFLYGGADVKQPKDRPGRIWLVMKCAAGRQDRPGRNLGFEMSVQHLEQLGMFCLQNAVKLSPQSKGR
jgi:hypothetical protein